MELKVFERLILLNVIPKEGNYLDLKIMRELKEALSFDEEEQSALQFDYDKSPGQVLWKHDADIPKEINIGPRAMVIISDTFKKLDKENKLMEEHLPIYEKFVEDK
jgi:hypothetical protein